MNKKTLMGAAALSLVIGLIGLACGTQSQEAQRVTLPVVTSGEGLRPVQNAEGYEVTITSAQMIFSDVAFTTQGELHTEQAPLWKRIFVKEAQAHPGHYAGGDTIGELPGRHVALFDAQEHTLGASTMLVGQYNGFNLTLTRATATDIAPQAQELAALQDHTVVLNGVATKAGKQFSFVAKIAQDEGRQIVGAPLDKTLLADEQGKIALMLLSASPSTQETLLDGVDFEALDQDQDGDVEIAPGSPEHNLIRRALSSHELYQAKFIKE